MSKRPYPKKKDEEKRIVISFTLSDDRLRWFKEAMVLETGHEPSLNDIREHSRSIAQAAIDDWIKRKVEFDGHIML